LYARSKARDEKIAKGLLKTKHDKKTKQAVCNTKEVASNKLLRQLPAEPRNGVPRFGL